MAQLERRVSLNDRQASKSGKNDSTCVISDCYSQDGAKLRSSDLDAEGKKRSRALKDHIFALKEHIKKTDEFLSEELNTISPRVKLLKEALNT